MRQYIALCIMGDEMRDDEEGGEVGAFLDVRNRELRSSKKQNKPPPNTNRQQQNPKQTDRPKSIQNIGNRNDHGRGGTMSYQQGYSTMQPEMLSRHPVLLQQQQYRQQQLMGPPQTPAQTQYYYDSMYSNYTGSTVTRDVVSLVRRKDLYPQNSYDYGGDGYSSRKTDGRRRFRF
ncbi:unnamed protein product [Orchesella dallaii]|uniref:Uncharacterized protein n=1 Tax=Orchesella dallaii TaxID=48710 RepID=A0ABP1QQT3_9HEXA